MAHIRNNVPNILLTHPEDVRRNYFRPEAVAELGQLGSLRINHTGAEYSTSALIEAAKGCEIMVAYRETPADAALFDALPDLKAYVRCAVDIRNIDLAAASRNGILVTHVSSVFVSGVAEWTIAAMIDVGRNFSASIAAYRAGHVPAPLMGLELRGASLGIIGYGRISQYLCDLALAFGMRVTVSDPYVKVAHAGVAQQELPELLAQSDYVVCLAVANASTENLMNAQAFALMKPSAFFINPSRGNLVDEGALLHALESNQIAGCALDVGRALDQMPSPALTAHPRVIATPHVAGLTPALDAQSIEAIAQTKQILKGEIPMGALNAESATRIHATTTAQARAGGMTGPLTTTNAMRQRMPNGACDCHMHIYDERFKIRPDVVMRIAPVSAYREVCATLGIQRMVVVQPVAYGFDNACTLDAMAQLGSAARGIVVIKPETPDVELQRLHALGVRGVRHMMILPGGLGWDSMEQMAHAVSPLGWSLNLQFDGHQLPERLDFLKSLPVNLVIDHIGSFHGGVDSQDASFKALLKLMDTGRTWVKLSAPYSYGMSRSGPPLYEDIGRIASLLATSYPDRCLWASNWPHPTEAVPPDSADMLSLLEQWVPNEGVREGILVGNAGVVYGYGEHKSC